MLSVLFDLLDGSPLSILGVGLHVLIAVYFAIHAVRSRQDTYWLYILFVFPLLGSIVYFFSIYLPDIRRSRTANVATRTALNIVDPHRAVRAARTNYDAAPTVQNRMRLGEALLAGGSADQVKEAREHFESAAQGTFADEPSVLLGLARARFANGDDAAARDALAQLLKTHAPARSEPQPTLLYAKVLAKLNDPAARNAFEQAIIHGDDAAARCLYAEWLTKTGAAADRDRARALFAEIEHDAKHWPRFARTHNREWLKRAKSGLAGARA